MILERLAVSIKHQMRFIKKNRKRANEYLIKKIMTNLKIWAEQAMNVLEVNESNREILQKRL